MDISSGPDRSAAEAGEFVAANAGDGVLSVEPLSAWNSGVFRVFLRGGGTVIVKSYGEGRKERADVEFRALRFLGANGLKRVPAPLFRSPDGSLCAYGELEGRKLRPEQIGRRETGSAVSLLAEIAALSSSPGAEALPAAAEACFTVDGYLLNVDRRLDSLRGAAASGGYAELSAFLDEAAVFRKEAAGYARKACAARGLLPGAELRREARILSPSDVGFHNILTDEGGTARFVDFEYFGWDDPAKTAADFILEPAVPFPAGLRGFFLERFAESVPVDPDFRKRLSVIFPLLGLKWALIMLNDFLPSSPRRRAMTAGELGTHLAGQLGKAGAMLRSVAAQYAEFAVLAAGAAA